jgi:hypothetical protein
MVARPGLVLSTRVAGARRQPSRSAFTSSQVIGWSLLLDCGSHNSSLAHGIPARRAIATQASTLEAAPGRYLAVCVKKRSAPVLTLAVPNRITELSDRA